MGDRSRYGTKFILTMPAANTDPTTTSTNGIMDESGLLNIFIPILSSHDLFNVVSSP